MSAGNMPITQDDLHAYVDGVHEEEAAALFREKYPDLPVTLSSELVPQIQEYERTSTTVVNAYVDRFWRRVVSRRREAPGDVEVVAIPVGVVEVTA